MAINGRLACPLPIDDLAIDDLAVEFRVLAAVAWLGGDVPIVGARPLLLGGSRLLARATLFAILDGNVYRCAKFFDKSGRTSYHPHHIPGALQVSAPKPSRLRIFGGKLLHLKRLNIPPFKAVYV